jgi:hypothetical protein
MYYVTTAAGRRSGSCRNRRGKNKIFLGPAKGPFFVPAGVLDLAESAGIMTRKTGKKKIKKIKILKEFAPNALKPYKIRVRATLPKQ